MEEEIKIKGSPRLAALTALFEKQEYDLILEDLGALADACSTVLVLTKPARAQLVAAAFMRAEKEVQKDEIVNIRLDGDDKCIIAVGARTRQRRLLVQDNYFEDDAEALAEPAKAGHIWVVVDWGDPGVSVAQVKTRRKV